MSSKLLLADDSVTIQKVVNLTFADEGIEVFSVGDGNSAMDKFLEISPDLVMADVNMPGIDGYRICEMIKQDNQTKNVPVVLLVGSFEPFDEEEAKRVGANDYLTKPFQSIRQLVEKVSDLLEESKKAEKVAFAKPKEAEVQTFETVESDEVSSTETIDSVRHTGSDGNKFGDAGMDDEMIQTNQVGSLPIDEVQRFESNDSDSDKELRDFPAEFRNVGQPQYEVSEGAAETQPLSRDEFNVITAEADEEGDSQIEEVVYEPAEEQTYSEAIAETEVIEEPTESEEEFVPTMIPTEQYFQPEEVVDEDQAPIQEIPQEKGFEIEEAREYEVPSMDETLKGFEASDQDETPVQESSPEPEPVSKQETSQPGFIDKLRHIFRDREETAMPSVTKTAESSEQTDFFRDSNAVEVETTTEETQFESNVPETSQVTVAEPEEETEQEEFAQFDDKIPQTETESEVSEPETAEFEQAEVQPEPFDFHQHEVFESQVAVSDTESEQQVEAESTQWTEVQTEPAEEVEEVSDSGQGYTQTAAEVAEPEFEEVSDETAQIADASEVFETEQEIAVEEEKTPEIPQDSAKAETVEAAKEKTQESAVEEVAEETPTKEKKIIDLDEANLLEITPGEKMSPIKSMISSELREEKSDAGESMIVSEYARQSISLSSEVIDMIADRVADKIAEKVIRELSSEVVSDLADLVVERMERKQLE